MADSSSATGGGVNPSTIVNIPPAGDLPAGDPPATIVAAANPTGCFGLFKWVGGQGQNPAGQGQTPAGQGSEAANPATANPATGFFGLFKWIGGQQQTPAGEGTEGTEETRRFTTVGSSTATGNVQKWNLSTQKREILEGLEKLDEKLMQDVVEIEKTADKAVLMALGISSAVVTMTTFPAMVVIRVGGDILFSLIVSIPATWSLFSAFLRSKAKLERLTKPITKAVEDEDVILGHVDVFVRDLDDSLTAAELRMCDLRPSDANRIKKLRSRHSGLRKLQRSYMLLVLAIFLLSILSVGYLCFGQYFSTAKDKITPSVPIAPMASPPPPPPPSVFGGMYFGGLFDMLFGWDGGIDYYRCFRRGPC